MFLPKLRRIPGLKDIPDAEVQPAGAILFVDSHPIIGRDDEVVVDGDAESEARGQVQPVGAQVEIEGFLVVGDVVGNYFMILDHHTAIEEAVSPR